MKYNTIQYNTIQYNTIQYNTIQYVMLIPAMTCIGPTAFFVPHLKPIILDASLDIVPLFIIMNKQPSSSYNTIQYNTIQYNTIQYNTV